MSAALPMTQPMIEVDSLRVELSGAGEILHGVGLSLDSGEVLGLLGPNGAGKSTLARAISGLIPARAGSIRIAGDELRSLPRSEVARRIAYLSQEMPQDLPFTAAEVVLMGRSPHLGPLGLDGPADRARASAALEKVEAAQLANRPLDALSGGERRRVLLARLLAQDAPIWVLDEPTAHLDLAHQHLALRLAREHADRGGVVVCVLHDLTHAAELCDRILILERGDVVAAGPPEAVLTADLLSRVFRVPFVGLRHPESGATTLHPLPKLRGG